MSEAARLSIAPLENAPEGTAAPVPASPRLVERLGLVFLGTFFTLVIFPWPLGLVPGLRTIATGYNALRYRGVAWVAEHVLGLPTITVFPNSGTASGDTVYNHVELLCFGIIALVTAVVWSIARRERPAAKLAYEWFRVYLRLFLGATLIGYGTVKVVKSQFPFPSLDLLSLPLGDLTPHELLWNFTGYSGPYNVFAGLGEVVGGALLFFRRTTLLGALISVGVMSNVVMLNYGYDVTVKLFSTTLLVMGVFILLPDLRRLTNLLISNRPVPAADQGQVFTSRRWIAGSRAGAVALLGFVSYTGLRDSYAFRNVVSNAVNARGQLSGVYDVEVMTRNGDAVPPLVTDSTRWRQLIIMSPVAAAMRSMSDSMRYFAVRLDTTQQQLDLMPRPSRFAMFMPGGPPASHQLKYTRGDGGRLVLDGVAGNDSVRLELRRVDESRFALLRHGFHWVHEEAFTR